MPPRHGLGPKGFAAVRAAGETFRRADLGHAPVINERPARGNVGNPAAISAPRPREEEFAPDYWYTFDSSRVVEAAYDKPNQRLFVRFVKPHPGGTPWTYEGVPENVWKNFRRAQSAGKFVNRVLNNYDYHRGNWDNR